jgi:hypothetical protein
MGCGDNGSTYVSEDEGCLSGDCTGEPSTGGSSSGVGTGGASSSTGGAAASTGGATASTGGATASTGGSTAGVLTALPRLHVDGLWLKDPRGNKVQLRGFAIEEPRAIIDWHKGGGLANVVDKISPPKFFCNVVRVPVHPDTYWQFDPDTYVNKYLRPTVDALTKKNVYVIIDWHPIKDYVITQYNNVDWSSKTAEFWHKVAPIFADYPNVIYEIFNEPIGPGGYDGWDTWRSVAQPWVDIIRGHAPESIIIVNSPGWSNETQYAPDRPFRGTNLIYAVHMYPYYRQEDRWFDERLGEPAKRLPIFLTEWGFQNSSWVGQEVKDPSGTWPTRFKAYLEARQHINWVAWSFSSEYYPITWTDQTYTQLTQQPEHQGQFMHDFLYDIRERLQPQP